MFEELNAHRQAVRENIEKAFEIGFTGNNDLEKARQVGDIHPNGKWVWTQLPSGKYDWRVIKRTDAPSSGSASVTAQKTAQSGKKPSKPVSQEIMEEFMDILKQSPYHRDSKRQFDSMSDSELKKFKDLAYKCSNDENLNQRTREECEKWSELANKEIENRSANKSNDDKAKPTTNEQDSGFKGSSFREEVRYKKSDWEAWKKSAPKDFEVEKLDKNLFGVYLGNKHVGTYDSKREVLMCDDTKLFGNSVK